MNERYRSPKISIPVDDVDVTLEEFDTEDLVKELKHRNAMDAEKKTPMADELTDIHALLRAGRIGDAMTSLEALLWPKWRTLDQCVEAFTKAKKQISDHQ